VLLRSCEVRHCHRQWEHDCWYCGSATNLMICCLSLQYCGRLALTTRNFPHCGQVVTDKSSQTELQH
jgi:hypothetical protein